MVSVKSLMINECFNVGYKQSLPHCLLTQKTSRYVWCDLAVVLNRMPSNVLLSQSLWASAVVSRGKSSPWRQSRAVQRPQTSSCVQSPESWWGIQSSPQVRWQTLRSAHFILYSSVPPTMWTSSSRIKCHVCSTDGYSYERDSIESWIRGKNKTSPMTNLPLQTTLLTPNRSLKTAIARWKLSQ